MAKIISHAFFIFMLSMVFSLIYISTKHDMEFKRNCYAHGGQSKFLHSQRLCFSNKALIEEE